MLLAVITYGENAFYINLNNNDLETGVELDLSLRDELQRDESRYIVGVNYIKVDQNESLVDIKIIGQGQFYVGYDSLFAGVGIKLVHLNSDFQAIPLGLVMALNIDQLAINRITIMGQIFYSPKPLTFSEGSYYKELRAEVSYDLIPLTKIYAGYRDINIEYNDKYRAGEQKLDYSSSAYYGIKFIF
jgi:hypothetical protein